jgi:hypothetical protein
VPSRVLLGTQHRARFPREHANGELVPCHTEQAAHCSKRADVHTSVHGGVQESCRLILCHRLQCACMWIKSSIPYGHVTTADV